MINILANKGRDHHGHHHGQEGPFTNWHKAVTIKVTNWHKGRDHKGHQLAQGPWPSSRWSPLCSWPTRPFQSCSKLAFTFQMIYSISIYNQFRFLKVFFKIRPNLIFSSSSFSKQCLICIQIRISSPELQLYIFHFPNDVLNFHSHLFIFSRFSLKPGQSWYFPPVHFKSNNLFAFKFASLVHSYSYLVKSSLSKIIFYKSTLNLETVSFIKKTSFQTISRPRLHLDTFHFYFNFLFPFSWLLLSPFSWSFLSHFIFPNQGHISKILHIPKFPKSFHFPFYLKFSFTLHLPRPGSHQ